MSAGDVPLRSIETRSPFRRSRESRAALRANISGRMPEWLRGEVVRTCPAVFETGEWRAQHWFDGLGMVYAFRITEAGVDFRSRLLDSEAARDAWNGKAQLAGYGTPSVRPLLQRMLQPIPRASDNTNVNIVRMGRELVAMTEGDRQLIVDDETLASVQPVPYTQDKLAGAIMTAHPHFDFERGKVVNVATDFGIGGTIAVYEHSPVSRQREIIGAWRTNHVPYIHTFGLTPQHAILVAHPFTVAPVKMLWSSKGYIDHFDWHAEDGTRLVVINRSTGEVREHVTDAFFAFHTVNAFERGDETVLDVLTYPNADIVADLRVNRMATQLPDLRPSLQRVTLRAGVTRARVEPLAEVGFEFPAIHYKRVNGRAYQFAYGAANGPDAGGDYPSAIVKIDLATGDAQSYSDTGYVFGEPIFVARTEHGDEDDGVLLTVGSAHDAESSKLAVIDAQTMALLASAEVPSAIPLGFHGSFMRTQGSGE